MNNSLKGFWDKMRVLNQCLLRLQALQASLSGDVSLVYWAGRSAQLAVLIRGG
jgi:hypothetical protein